MSVWIPARDLGWSCKDPIILQSQGQVSRLLVRGIDIMATQRHELGEMLQGPGAFFDVGTGVGWLAIEAARSWPALRVVGIDPWEPALTLARQNLAQSGIAERVELRLQRVEQFEETTTFTVAWLPGPFLPAAFQRSALFGHVDFGPLLRDTVNKLALLEHTRRLTDWAPA